MACARDAAIRERDEARRAADDLSERALAVAIDKDAALAKLKTVEEWKQNTEAILADPTAVHVNMLRGTIATPSKAQLLHVLGDQSLSTAEAKRDALTSALAEAKGALVEISAQLASPSKAAADAALAAIAALTMKAG